MHSVKPMVPHPNTNRHVPYPPLKPQQAPTPQLPIQRNFSAPKLNYSQPGVELPQLMILEQEQYLFSDLDIGAFEPSDV
jgi:hypothetical protein